jgi:hypothetical protein
MHGGSFVYDPWVLYAAGPAQRREHARHRPARPRQERARQSWMYRSRVFGRICELIDPKGEYAPLVEALGGEVLTLHPRRADPAEPADAARQPRDARRAARGDRARDARPAAHPARSARPVRRARRRRPARRRPRRLHPRRHRAAARPQPRSSPTQLACSRKRSAGGPARMRARAAAPHPRPAARHVRPANPGSEAVWDAPAVCLDLSQVGVGQAQSNLAVAIVMVCASAFLDAKRRERAHRRARRRTRTGQDDPRQRRVLARPADRRPRRVLPVRVQALRDSGVQHILALHRLSDLRSAGDDGSRQQRLAQGLLAEASTTVVYRQHAQEVPDTADALGLSSTARERIARLPAGRRAVVRRRPLLRGPPRPLRPRVGADRHRPGNGRARTPWPPTRRGAAEHAIGGALVSGRERHAIDLVLASRSPRSSCRSRSSGSPARRRPARQRPPGHAQHRQRAHRRRRAPRAPRRPRRRLARSARAAAPGRARARPAARARAVLVLATVALVACLRSSCDGCTAATRPRRALGARDELAELHTAAARRPGGSRSASTTAADRRRTRASVLCVGPAQSGKTTGLIVPAILEWQGPVVSTSVKADVVHDTHRARAGSATC